MLQVIKNQRNKKIAHQTVIEETEAIAKRIKEKTDRFVDKLKNGGGTAIINALTKQ